MKKGETNPYIPLVEQDKNIINIYEDIYKNKGKWKDYFKNNNEIVLEIGTGLGNYFSNLCSSDSSKNFIGMEIKFKRLYFSSQKSIEKGAKNNFVLIKDFGQNIDKIFSENEVSEIIIFFPDPWWKKDRQVKHRLITEDFLLKLNKVLKKGGKVCFKTDHKGYFDLVLELLNKNNLFNLGVCSYDYEAELEHFDKQNMTEFECIFREDRLKINYLEIIKK